jgi:hypothetical protein
MVDASMTATVMSARRVASISFACGAAVFNGMVTLPNWRQ